MTNLNVLGRFPQQDIEKCEDLCELSRCVTCITHLGGHPIVYWRSPFNIHANDEWSRLRYVSVSRPLNHPSVNALSMIRNRSPRHFEEHERTTAKHTHPEVRGISLASINIPVCDGDSPNFPNRQNLTCGPNTHPRITNKHMS